MAPLSHAPASSSAPAGVGQASLDFSPRPARAPAPKRTRPAGERAVDPRLKLALRLCLEARHVGRARAATWEQLREELNAEGAGVEDGLFVSNVRRLQEAAAVLRRVDKVAIGGDSQAGVYIVGDDAERRFIAAERVKRIRAEVKELEAFDRAMYERIAEALPLEEEAA